MAKKDAKGKQQKGPKEKKPRNLYKLYEVQGDKLVRKNQFSPKSPGDFLANHKDRKTCGKTGYTEFVSKAPAKEENSKKSEISGTTESGKKKE